MADRHPLSAEVAGLMQAVAVRVIEEPGPGLALVDAASLAAAPQGVRVDPTLAASMQAATKANLLHWLGQVLVDPGVPVPPALSREGTALARDLVRRGLDAGALDTYRAGQNAAWQLWMEACFAVTDDPRLLHELLAYSAQSIFRYVDATMASISALVERERESLTQNTHAQRLETVLLVLDGAPIEIDVANRRLAHDVRRVQTSAVLWTDSTSPQQGQLERAADVVGRVLGVARPLTVVASAASLWAWYAVDASARLTELTTALAELPDVRVAVGSSAPGLAGFRRSHLDAIATQRLMLRAPVELQVATHDDVDVVALLAADEERASEFASRTLGALAGDEPELRETLRVYLREDASATRAARALFTHRNTVLNRLNRAQALLPAPLAGRGLQVALALEIVHWLGPPGRAPRT